MSELYARILPQVAQQIAGVMHFGAHVGEEADLYVANGIENVVWVEPNPELLPRLKAKVDPLGHLVIPCVVSWYDCEGRQLHIASNDGGSSSVHRFATHATRYPQISMTKTISVPGRSVKSCLSFAQQEKGWEPNFLYFDIQGEEYHALFGACESGAIHAADFIYAEVQFEKLYEGTECVEAIDGLLTDFSCEAVMDTGSGWGEAFYVRRRRTAGGMLKRWRVA